MNTKNVIHEGRSIISSIRSFREGNEMTKIIQEQ